MSVTNTISATESLDERIKFTEEEAAKLAATIAAAEVVRAAKTAMPKLLGVALLAVAFLCALMAYGSLIAAVDEKEELKTAGKALFWLMTGGFLAGTWLAGRRALALVSRPNVALNLTDEEARLAALRADIHRLKERRRALLIAHSEDVLARDHVGRYRCSRHQALRYDFALEFAGIGAPRLPRLWRRRRHSNFGVRYLHGGRDLYLA